MKFADLIDIEVLEPKELSESGFNKDDKDK